MRTTIERTLDFGMSGAATEVTVHGWSDPEARHTWTLGNRSALCVEAPVAPFGYLLEITWSPYLPTPWLKSQPVTLLVGGRRICSHEVARAETVAFRCPPPRPGERRLLIEFDHPEAAQPSAVAGHHDQRMLALCVERIRIFRLDEPVPDSVGRGSRQVLRARDPAGLRAEAERLTGLALDQLLSRFEVVAGDCDMGLALRELGFESLSLLRFAGATASVAIRGIENGFDGIGEQLSAQIADNPIAEWMVTDAFGLRYHTHQSSRVMSQADVIAMQRRHVAILRRKFLEDLAEGEKIFVYADHHAMRPPETALALFVALNRQRPTRMLWVCPDDGQNPGGVEEILPGLARAALDPFAPPLAAGHITVGGWLTVLCNAWQVLGAGVAAATPTRAPARAAALALAPRLNAQVGEAQVGQAQVGFSPGRPGSSA